MASKTDIDQDALTAEWNIALDGDAPAAAAPAADAPEPGGNPAPAGDGNDEMAAQWAAMIDDGSQFVQAAKGGA